MIMKTIEQKNITTAAPENKTIKLSIAAAQHLAKTNVENVLEKINKVPLSEFAENENRTLTLWEMLWVPKEKLWALTLWETLKQLWISDFQVANNLDYKWKTVPLWWYKKAA